MNESQQQFRERLLNAEKSLPTEKYRREMAGLQERKLSALQRTVIAAVAASVVSAAVFMGWLATIPSEHLPMLARFGLGFGAVCSLAAGGVALRIAMRGIMKRKSDPNLVAGIIFVSLVVFSTSMLMLMDQVADAAKRVEMGSTALLFFGAGCLFVLLSRAEQTELRTREKLLEIELQVLLLADEVGKAQGHLPGTGKQT